MMERKLRSPLRKDIGRIPLLLVTKPYRCGGHCIYCITDRGFGHSSVSNDRPNEDALLAKDAHWEPNAQIENRIKLYNLEQGMKHKYSIDIKGDSFTSHSRAYLESYVKGIYDYLNGKISPTLEEAKEHQRHGADRCVMMSIETRPDLINEEWCEFLLNLGVTIIEIGVQSLDDKVLELNRRGHTVEAVAIATKLLKQYGFRVVYHMMPNLPGSNIELDYDILTNRLWQAEFSPDDIKIYPCILLKKFDIQIELVKHLNKDWFPFSDQDYLDFLFSVLPRIPEYALVARIQRIVDEDRVAYGPKKVIDRNIFNGISKCMWQRFWIRSRMVLDVDYSHHQLTHIKQGDNGFLIQAVITDNCILGYGRVYFPNKESAIIRDLQVLGKPLFVGEKTERGFGIFQHQGIGKEIIHEMEKLTIQSGTSTIKVHPGVGAIAYFEELGYRKTDSNYMVKTLFGHLNQ